ncbi:hypothetical protein [Novosphingobium panipatense]|uniref:hypothetical protein n=1 Tax=Novosphingobium panipatense TaxID=428991 RepID=UPI0036237929
MERLRVIQWTTGKVGKHALRAILDDPRLELVGCFAWSDDKNGQDAGALCGRPDTGILATNDVETLLALGADTILYTPFEADLDHAVRLLESGADMVSTNLFLNVGGIRGEVKERLEAACARKFLAVHHRHQSRLDQLRHRQPDCDLPRCAFRFPHRIGGLFRLRSVETWGFLGIGEPGA